MIYLCKMVIKDYYNILQLPPSASVSDIKKTFRKLAHEYHPDKNNNDPYATARFAEIKEAYEVLTHPSRRDYYLQQRWYQQSLGKKKTREMVTPVSLLKQFLDLDKYVSKLDVHRMDKHGLQAYIIELINDEMIEKLNAYKEPDINQQIILTILKTSTVLPYSLLAPLKDQLNKIESDEITRQKVNDSIERKHRFEQLNKYRPAILFVIVIILSLVIYYVSRE